MGKRLESSSKFLSLVLRHQPEAIGLTLDAEGWADIDLLIELAAASGRSLTRALVQEVVAGNDKQRFAISTDGKRIRANQGHSIQVDLKLAPQMPPAELFHGTARRFIPAIAREGLMRQSRQHVHLSATRDVATRVGARHGSPVVLVVQACLMQADGYLFFQSENGVWLTERVPPRYLRIPEGGDAP